MRLYKYIRPIALVLIDMAMVSAAYYAAFWLRLEMGHNGLDQRHVETIRLTLPWLLGIRFLCGFLVRQYTWSFRHASLPEAVGLVKAAVVGTAIFFAIFHLGRAVIRSRRGRSTCSSSP